MDPIKRHARERAIPAGTRSRFSEETAIAQATPEISEQESDSSIVRSTGSIAIATIVSRITGFVKTILILAVLETAVASAFNIANILPNMITEIVLGAVLTALVVPVLIRAEKEDSDGGAAFIRRLLTISGALLAITTIFSVIAAPLLTQLNLGDDSKVNVTLSTAFAYFLLPQIVFYGMSALLMAILNTKGVFRPGAWAPVWNNLVVLAVFVLYRLLGTRIQSDQPVSLSDPAILLLGLGTTAGVVVQALVLIRPLRRLGIDLRPLWGIDDRLKSFAGMAGAIVVYVAISQIGLVVTNRIAASSDDAAVAIYQTSWLLLQVPYGIIGVALLTAIMPRLSRNAADSNNAAVVRDLSIGSRLTLVGLVPIIVVLAGFGPMIANALFAYGQFDSADADILGATLAASAFTLIPYALVLLHLRVFYAREQAWLPTFIILGITATKIVLSLLAPVFARDPQHVVVWLGVANGAGFVAGALVGALLLRRSLGRLGMRAVGKTLLWTVGASLIGVFSARGIDALAGFSVISDTWGSPGYALRAALNAVVALLLTAAVLSRSGLHELKPLGAMLDRILAVFPRRRQDVV